jgi:type III secretion protein T
MDPLRLNSLEDMKSLALGLTLVQARLMPMFLLVPLFNRSIVPRTIAFGISAGLGLLILPTLPVATIGFGPELILLVGKEAVLGAILGFLVAVPFWIFETLGFVIDNQRGASMAATLNPLTGHDSSPLGMLTAMAFITFFMVAGGIQVMLGLIYDSYRQWPPLSFWPRWTPEAATLLLQQINRLMTLGLLLAAPALMAMFLAELGLALANRFAPQLQVFFLAMPIKSALGIFVLCLYAATLFDFGLEPIRQTTVWLQRLSPLLGGPGRE